MELKVPPAASSHVPTLCFSLLPPTLAAPFGQRFGSQGKGARRLATKDPVTVKGHEACLKLLWMSRNILRLGLLASCKGQLKHWNQAAHEPTRSNKSVLSSRVSHDLPFRNPNRGQPY